jgi:hypothetical protein
MTKKFGHMFYNQEKDAQQFYDELEGFNFIQLLSLGEVKGG